LQGSDGSYVVYHAAGAELIEDNIIEGRDHPVNTRNLHQIWVEQCNAAHEIKLRYGVKAAFDYLVAEKLLNFADAATSRPEFAKELPRFVAYVRGLFTPQEMRAHLARIEREQTEYAAENDDEEDDDDELIRESPAAAAERARQFAIVKELLTAAELGTS
jgi:hypothetical protein